MRWLAVACVVMVACGGGKQARVQEPHHEPHTNVDYARHGLATFYDESQMTASGERFDKHALTAAHRTLRMGTMVRVTNERNGRTVVVRINDRGPFGNKSRIIDLSEAAAKQLDMIDAGVVPVTLEVLP
ncbi:MAG: septal ring lytic transglycosylase RlpA family protein [Kofleriaceae bacterium]